MSKELEALEELKEFADMFDDGHKWDETFSNKVSKNLAIIEESLKKLEEIEEDIGERFDKVRGGVVFKVDGLKTYQDEHDNSKSIRSKKIQKKVKAFDIIKNKKVNVKCLTSGWNLGKYNSYKTHEPLTEQEFKLLKEVLS